MNVIITFATAIANAIAITFDITITRQASDTLASC